MDNIKIDYSEGTINQKHLKNAKETVKTIHNKIHSKEEYDKMPLGWLDTPIKIEEKVLEDIVTSSKRLRSISDTIISLGIGGSYIGGKAAIEMLNPKNKKVVFAGNNISGQYLNLLIEEIEQKDFSLIVISKSGTTLETAIAFRILKDRLLKKYGKDEAAKRIVAITDKTKGVLRAVADKEGYESFVIPENVGGRYSVLTPAGLYTIAAADIDIYEIIEGAKEAYYLYNNEDMDKNPAYKYSALRNMYYDAGKAIEILISYEPTMLYFSEWWKQLFGESEGKERKGLFPTSLQFTTDLHSMGQFLQEGTQNVFETVLNFKSNKSDISIPYDFEDIDGLNYLQGKTLNFINDIAFQGVKEAHESSGMPIITINIPEKSPYYFGQLVYFFQKACAISGYIINVNPFNQPGVEKYKKNIFKLLGR
ncbi:MAG: glucose-6-phosphate isomerase [Firmicutes bacterium]|nr:glucose-6-phosphate isomerase [Bacillota bacterium]